MLHNLSLIHREIAEKLRELEAHVGRHDKDLQAIVKALHLLTLPTVPSKRRIGF